jgi:hypothetical protein
MPRTTTDLQQLRGVGSVLAKRLSDAGFDSLEKLAGGEDDLRQIPGISPTSIDSIVKQAKQLAEAYPHGDPGNDQAVRKLLAQVKAKLEALARTARDRYEDQLSGKTGKKVTSDLVRVEDALGQLGKGQLKRPRRAAKALGKVEKRVSGLEDASLKKIRKRLKRAKKAVKKAL